MLSQTNTQAARSHDTDVEHAIVAVEDVDTRLFTEVRQAQAGLPLTPPTDQPKAFPCAFAGMPFHLFTPPEQPVVQDRHGRTLSTFVGKSEFPTRSQPIKQDFDSLYHSCIVVYNRTDLEQVASGNKV